MTGLLGLALLVLDIVAIIDIVKIVQDTGKKIPWVLLILILPVVGLALYYLLGRKKA